MNRRGFAPIIILLIVAGILIAGGAWYYEAHQSQPFNPPCCKNNVGAISLASSSGGMPVEVYLNEVAPFKALFPVALSADQKLATTVNSYVGGKVFYQIKGASGTPLILVTQAEIGTPAADRLETPDEMSTYGTVTSTKINGQIAYVGIVNKVALTPMTMVLFQYGNVAIQLSTLDAIDPQVLVGLAGKMAPTASCALDANGLPPDPGEAGKQTLSGIDCDHDGVRDDVQRWIALSNPQSRKLQLGLTQEARAILRMELDSTNKDQALSDSNAELDASSCLAGLLGSVTQSEPIEDHLHVVILNTADRQWAYRVADALTDGSAYTLPNLADRIKKCDFDPNALPN